ncbi:DUF1402 family protein [Nitratireductor aquimarinus]|uniref:DUF1402 family protein n=1 Tax=Nitratireductor TaxID=245876 RepID=UPI000DE07E14|nr:MULTISPECIES: DUF1402 family protein [Nitratireductor]MBN7777154.1 DUF1402 family protein [Nitratireductor pacificus]MBN7780825.1 DUF1402 family protein [Nitratireductor pacificus]MBN7789631.1 DUF1402 family protein [Nitratireductor aquimarinus]MBN8244973.1 DUF1402 family protein [Nitratireductor aquimarinus]MBY6099363.1 DUF1402 family protein [Nitratireductor aquimarinus]
MAPRARLVIGICLGFFCVGTLPVSAAKLVPEGNRNAKQPPVPGVSAKRTKSAQTTYEAKYGKVYQLLKTDGGLVSKIRSISSRYNIDPVHMVGAIVGEHTYNVDAYDRLQTYYVKAVSYLKSDFSFSYGGETVGQFVERPEFADCEKEKGSYDIWSCREAVWDKSFRGKSVDGKKWPNDRFGAVFFQPFYAGQTFGIGQLNPLTALKMTDTVNRVSGFRQISHTNPQEVYQTIMDPDKSLAYVAATVKKSIAAYRQIADFDISKNPGITATLYNLGNPEARAARLAAENRVRRAKGQRVKLPEENYYGWLVNEKLDELKALFQDS